MSRTCGTCTLCCKLLPVLEISKPRNRWCSDCAPGQGCKVYDRRPVSCRNWSCNWLLDELTMSDDLRPDKSKVVVDPTLDRVLINNVETQALQLWVDPAYPAAHRAPAIRRLIELAARRGVCTIARIGNLGLGILAPQMSPTGKWEEKQGVINIGLNDAHRDEIQRRGL